MALFRCSIRGENFPGEMIRMKGLVGFYTTRWIEADSAEHAEMSALELLRTEPTFQIKSPKLREQSKAKVYFEEILEVASDTPRVPPNKGATWFEMN